jgi:hypothetical protein
MLNGKIAAEGNMSDDKEAKYAELVCGEVHMANR